VLVALDLDEHADRRLVDGDDGVAERVLFAVFLVAEPDGEAELLQAAQHRLAVADDRLDFLADFHRGGLNRALEGEEAAPRLYPHAEHAAPAPE